ncbi:MAG: Trk system potassium transporter TrkA [Phycisphaerae bacterium]|nr:Trk system potassium transporter TrkA [Phycisphaerae bacterium]
MDIIICGGGEIGSEAAEVLARRGDNVTVIDTDAKRLSYLEEHLDIRTLNGVASSAQSLRAAGAAQADAVIAVTGIDEVNLVCATVAASLGAGRTLARVDHSLYLGHESMDYATLFSVDRLFSPDRATARAMAARLANPAALAVSRVARGTVEIQAFPVDAKGSATGKKLRDISMPKASRAVAVCRDGKWRLPTADTRFKIGDRVTVVVDVDHFDDLDGVFTAHHSRQLRIAVFGGSAASVWLCRALKNRGSIIHLFEADSERSNELAEKLDWVTVINADLTAPSIFEDQGLDKMDAFLAMGDDDENMLGSAIARKAGIPMILTMTHRGQLEPLLEQLGVTKAFNPWTSAMEDIIHFISNSAFETVGTLGEEQSDLELVRIRIGNKSPLAGQTLRHIKPDMNLIVAVVEDESEQGHVPVADDVLTAGRHILVACEKGQEKQLRKLFDAR